MVKQVEKKVPKATRLAVKRAHKVALQKQHEQVNQKFFENNELQHVSWPFSFLFIRNKQLNSENQKAREEVAKTESEILGVGKTGIKGRLEAAQELVIQVPFFAYVLKFPRSFSKSHASRLMLV